MGNTDSTGILWKRRANLWGSSRDGNRRCGAPVAMAKNSAGFPP